MSYVTTVPRIFKKKWFWIGFIVLLLFAIIWDITLAIVILTTSLASGQWSGILLGLGFLYAVGVIYQLFLPPEKRRQVRWTGRLLLVVIIFLTFPQYGFFKTLYFLATVLIFARFTKWIVSFVRKKRRAKLHYA